MTLPKLRGTLLSISLLCAWQLPAYAQEENDKKTNGLPIEELRAFAEVFQRISHDYVESVDDKTLLENAIQGMLSNLDPHSAYLPPESFKKMEESTTGEFGGLGMEVGMEDGFVKVISPIDDTPAQKAGVQTNDLIIRLDETPVKGMSLNDAVKMMRGKPGTDIKLTIIRKGEEKPLNITLTRAIIHVVSVKNRLLDQGLGYVRISQFQVDTGSELAKAIASLERQNKGDLKGLVLDLRNNPGGVLTAAVEVSDNFLNEGKIVYTEGRINRSDMSFKAAKGDLLKGAPLVILVNEGSASASEIVAGAIQDHQRGLVVGRATFGKGSVQSIVPLRNGAAIKLTTARYFTPSGRSIQGQGIAPDIELPRLKVERVEEDSALRVKEKDLNHTLSNPTENIQPEAKDADVQSATQTANKEAVEEDALTKDYELYRAQQLLEAMILASAKK